MALSSFSHIFQPNHYIEIVRRNEKVMGDLQNAAITVKSYFVYLAMRILSVCPSVKRVNCKKWQKDLSRFLNHMKDHLA